MQEAKTVSCLYCGKRIDKRLICVIENCKERRFKECCYGMCAKHCGDKKYHYLEEGETDTKYPNIRDNKEASQT